MYMCVWLHRFWNNFESGGRIMRVKRGRARIAAEEVEVWEGASPFDGVEKFLSKTLKYAFLATLYQVFLKKIIKILSLPVVFFSTDVTPN